VAVQPFRPGFSANVVRKDGSVVHVMNAEDMPKDAGPLEAGKLKDAGAYDTDSILDAEDVFMASIVAQGSEDPQLREDVAIEAGRRGTRRPVAVPAVEDAGTLTTIPEAPLP